MPSPEAVAAALREAHRHLRDEPKPPPDKQFVPEPPPLVIETQEQRWYRKANEDIARREAADALRRRQEREDDRARAQVLAANDVRLAELERRLAVAEASMVTIDEFASGTAKFSDAVTSKLREFETLTAKLEATLTTLKHAHERECRALRDRLAASGATHSRETALLTRQLGDAQRELDRRADVREHARTRMQIAGVNENLENVVALVREDIASRS